MIRRAHALAAAYLLCGAGIAATAAPAPPPSLAQRVDALNDPDHATRTNATDALLCDTTLTASQLARVAGPTPPPETRMRLLHVVRHHSLRRLREQYFAAPGPGSIGIVQTVLADPRPVAPANRQTRKASSPTTAPPYALVTRVLPGFPACGRLHPHDRIIALNGTPLAGPARPATFQTMLEPFAAGDTVALTVLRDGTRLNITLTLANRAALAGIYVPPSHTLHPRFAEHWAQERKPFDWPADAPTSSAPASPPPG